MISRQRELAAHSHVTYLLSQAGYDVFQHASSQPYDLVAVKGHRFLPISIKASGDGGWTLTIRYKERATAYDQAVDRWLSEQEDDVLLALVQFVGTSVTATPRVYIARPVEVATQLKTHGTQHEPLIRGHRHVHHLTTAPSDWLFSQTRIDAI